ncbi:MAG: hypothetical protein ACD_50C00112G0007 [uncultured bacterium]|nr:MAG: hypothetical protein ACD_50C00112G0007 [uncultured bacterium]OGH13150.1 MAG: hypothetical protein A2687_05170 [Candidatus Levybacteria bacterium RIFCSPHIGHO2_01_FULL_38_26]
MVKNIVRLEGLFVFLAALYFYFLSNGNWLLFVILFLIPDLSMTGYLKDKKLGATIYNFVHNYILATLLIFVGILFQDILLYLGVILIAHVGIDRFFGFGLKYPTNFKDTHIHKL